MDRGDGSLCCRACKDPAACGTSGNVGGRGTVDTHRGGGGGTTVVSRCTAVSRRVYRSVRRRGWGGFHPRRLRCFCRRQTNADFVFWGAHLANNSGSYFICSTLLSHTRRKYTAQRPRRVGKCVEEDVSASETERGGLSTGVVLAFASSTQLGEFPENLTDRRGYVGCVFLVFSTVRCRTTITVTISDMKRVKCIGVFFFCFLCVSFIALHFVSVLSSSCVFRTFCEFSSRSDFLSSLGAACAARC